MTTGNSEPALDVGAGAETLYASILALASDAIVVTDAERRIVLFNRSAEAMFGYRVDEVLGGPFALLLPDRGEVRGRRKSGEEFPAEVAMSTALVDGAERCCAIVRDVSEGMRHEAALREREARFRGIFDSAFQFIGLLAPDGTLLEANQASLDFVGLSADAVRGRPFWETSWWTHSDAAQQRLQDGVRRASAGAFVRYEVEHHGADGAVMIVDFSLKPVADAHGRVTFLVAEGRDVTDARRLAARVQESEATFRGAFELSSIGMALVDLEGRWMRVNRALCAIVGYDEAELLQRTFQDITHPDDLATDLGLMQELLSGARAWYELEKRYVRKDGRVAWILLTGSLVRDPSGAPRFFIAQIQDVSERKRAEEALERQRVDLARSNAELEQFAYVASHDLQEPLRTVASYTRLLAERYAPQLDERAQRYVHYAVDGAERMHGLITDLLTLSRVGTTTKPFGVVSLDAVLDDVLRGLELVIADAGATVTRDRLPTVWGDEAQLGQLLQNLLANALRFHRPGLPPVVHVSATDGAQWTVTVEDRGIGIDPRFAEEIFVVFRRLHARSEYPGTGLGLAICKKVVERHGGRIWTEPAPDGGSIFRFTLPHSTARAE